jgi:chromosome segregation ATPase
MYKGATQSMVGVRGYVLFASVLVITILSIAAVYNYTQKTEMAQRLLQCDHISQKVSTENKNEISKLNIAIKHGKSETEKERDILGGEIKTISTALEESKKKSFEDNRKIEQLSLEISQKRADSERFEKIKKEHEAKTKLDEENISKLNREITELKANTRPMSERPVNAHFGPYDVDKFVYETFFKQFGKSSGVFVEIGAG